MPKQTFHFAIETTETFMPPKSQKEWEEAYFKQRKHVDEMIESNESPVPIYDLDELIKLSTKSRRTLNFEKKKKEHPSRPLNVFLIFRKNYEEGVRRSNKDTKIDVVSKDAAKEWKKWKKCSPVSALFTEIANLAKIYHKYKYPNYKFQPVKRGRNRAVLSSPESLESSPEMDDNSSPELSTSTPTTTPSSSPKDFEMFDGNGGNGLNLFATELTASTESDYKISSGLNSFATELSQEQQSTSTEFLTPGQCFYPPSYTSDHLESPVTPSADNFQNFTPDSLTLSHLIDADISVQDIPNHLESPATQLSEDFHSSSPDSLEYSHPNFSDQYTRLPLESPGNQLTNEFQYSAPDISIDDLLRNFSAQELVNIISDITRPNSYFPGSPIDQYPSIIYLDPQIICENDHLNQYSGRPENDMAMSRIEEENMFNTYLNLNYR